MYVFPEALDCSGMVLCRRVGYHPAGEERYACTSSGEMVDTVGKILKDKTMFTPVAIKSTNNTV